jgi:polar amino acid transport system permease protein
VRALPYGYIFFFRGTPLLVQLFLVYYGLAQFDAVRSSSLWPYLRDPFWCTVLTMTLHTAAYIAEILRGAIQAIPGRDRSGAGTGHVQGKALFYIMLPRAARIGLPAYSNEVILMLKASALASTVTLLELTGMARTIIARTYLPVEIFFAAGVFYLVISFVLVRASSCWSAGCASMPAKGVNLQHARGRLRPFNCASVPA